MQRFLIGPTAVGKTAVAIRLARLHPIAILSLDSMQVYRGMDIGTAKPSAAERAAAPHELIDLVDPSEPYSVARWLEEARSAEARARTEGRVPIYVGGTALYLKALLHGLFEGPSSHPEIRAALQERARAEGSGALHAELRAVDEVAAGRIHPNDTKRIVRALEVYAITGEPISSLQREWARAPGSGARVIGLALPRELLDARIARRVEEMLAAGWSDEVARLEAAGGLGPQAAAAVGYRAIAEVLRGNEPREGLETRITTATRRFARRQMTWFRSLSTMQWVRLTGEDDPDEVAELVARRLGLSC